MTDEELRLEALRLAVEANKTKQEQSVMSFAGIFFNYLKNGP